MRILKNNNNTDDKSEARYTYRFYDIVITFKLSMCQLTGNLTCKENMSSSSVSSNPLEGNKISFDLKVRLEL